MKIAINGFGRIGRMTLRALENKPEVEVVAVNDLTDIKTLTHLLKYDTAHGRFPGEVLEDGENIIVNEKKIRLLSEKDPAKLPWESLGVDVVVESTGRFTDKSAAQAHIAAGAKKVLITAPATGGVKTIVHGINDDLIGNDQIYSTASCTTGSIAPILYILDKEFGVKSGYMVTVHAFTADQNLQDAPHRDLRRARAATYSIIPTTTGAARAIGDVLPNLKGIMDGYSYRVPVIDASIVDLSVNLKKEVSAKELNELFKHYAENSLKGILEYTEEPLVSSDILGNTHSSVVDGTMTKNIGEMVKVVAWYDNEVGISNRIAEMVSIL
ncbi:glyceraldehyde-3-phosphate dehydrogenase (NAD+) [Arcticibacter tournemirensis]|uniref:Glyceraldehyde-3-phosphate dehydrogenase n=1 Tax=Arcticibacter tournemirensis TaxID=699437 RepID=A0A5M9HCM3_9SPHI|nr:type I glyceraldehyde-3-phosphate dehydrogenase [Arcticibacter tournemirensis]KAA8484075.1 type I glyceraldehyde-3-phosphate dehydrogenase [Arcticibacter tournemirensis]TQM51809.1 glyceraldehyde-3-phosphate dehydrogenase (NAD+) [Arcticibacter tournemirensis]